MATLAELSASGDLEGLQTGSTPVTLPLPGQAAPPSASPARELGPDPFAAPAETVYPEGAIPNPARNSRALPPACNNLPPGALHRPAFLPADCDDRLNTESIWMGIQKGSNKAVYFLPNACGRCSGNARFCDRGLPECSSCIGKPGGCRPGVLWATLRPKPKARLSKATNYSAMSPIYTNPFPQAAGPSTTATGSFRPAPQHASPSHVSHASPSSSRADPSSLTPNAALAASPLNGGSTSAREQAYDSPSLSRGISAMPADRPIHMPNHTADRLNGGLGASASRSTADDVFYHNSAGSAVPLSPSRSLSLHGHVERDISHNAPPTIHEAAVPVPAHTASDARSQQPATLSSPQTAKLPPSPAHAIVDRQSNGHGATLATERAETSTSAALIEQPPPLQPAITATPATVQSNGHAPTPNSPNRPSVAAAATADATRTSLTPAPVSVASLARPRAIEGSDDEDFGTSKRAAKKRRLTSDTQAKPEGAAADMKQPAAGPSTATLAAKKRTIRPSHIQPAALTTESHPDDPFSKLDAAFFARTERNLARPLLRSMKHACPVWSNTRMALQASTDYFRSPRRTAGGSVEIGLGGIARGVILEGDAPEHRYLWGRGKQIGTMILPIGKPRPSRRHTVDGSAAEPKSNVEEEEEEEPIPPGPSSPKVNILPDVRLVDPVTGESTPVVKPAGPNANATWRSPWEKRPPAPKREPEEECVEALLTAQRAATPVALAVTKDYSLFPYQVPRGICGLGWFFVVDAWVESNDIEYPDAPCTVQWLFRFEFCNGNVRLPWWQEEDEIEDRMKLPIVRHQSAAAASEPISGPNVRECTTARYTEQWFNYYDSPTSYNCPACCHVFTRVWKGETRCLNEYCVRFMCNTLSLPPKCLNPANDAQGYAPGPSYAPLREVEAAPMSARFYMEPATLGLRLRGTKPNVSAMPALAGEHGKDFWRGWICDKCGMANERRKWKGWECEGCKNQHSFLRTAITLAQVRNSNRPECSGPRPDNGFPSFPFDKTSTWSLFDDLSSGKIKIVKHELSRTPTARPRIGQAEPTTTIDDSGTSAVIYHALQSGLMHDQDRATVPFLNQIWRDFQAQGTHEMHFKRVLLKKSSRRPFEQYLCPYYTQAFGPFIPTLTEALPHEPAKAWQHAPEPVLDWMRYMNERASDMFAGSPEFNSLLILVTPPASVNAYQPKFTVQKTDRCLLTNLGSEITVKIRRSCKGKAGELIMQHGDVLGVEAREEDVELQLKADGFAFVGIARQAYRSTPQPGLGAMYDPKDPDTWRSIRDDEAEQSPAGIGAAEGGGLGLTLGEPEPSGAAEEASATGGADTANSDNLPPPVPTTYDENPLRDWYIGPRPLDDTQRIRRGPAVFERPIEGQEEDDEERDDGDVAGEDGPSGVDDVNRPAGIADTAVAPDDAAGVVNGTTADGTLEDDSESLYSQEPATPTLIRAEIPPSPTAPDPEDEIDTVQAFEDDAAADKAEKKAKRKKRQSEPAPPAVEKEDKRPEKKQKRVSEPAPKDASAVGADVKGKGRGGKAKEAASALTMSVAPVGGGADKGKGKAKQQEAEVTPAAKSKKRKSVAADLVHGDTAAITPNSKAAKSAKGKIKQEPEVNGTTPAASSGGAAKQPKKRKPRPSKANVNAANLEEGASPAGLDAPTPGSSGGGAMGTPVKLKLNVGKSSDGAGSTAPSRPGSAVG